MELGGDLVKVVHFLSFGLGLVRVSLKQDWEIYVHFAKHDRELHSALLVLLKLLLIIGLLVRRSCRSRPGSFNPAYTARHTPCTLV